MFAAGRANTPASTPAYIEEVFSTTLYTGDSTPRAITNDIALGSTAAWKTRTLLDGTSTYLYKVKKDTDGNYIVSGNSIVSGIYRVLVIKFDSSWNILWQKRISQDSTSQTATSAGLALDSSNNIYLAFGIEGAAASLVKLNSSGDLQWNRVIEPSTGSGRYLNTVLYNTVDGFLYVGGRTSGPGGPGLYAKYSTAGTLQWMYKFKPPGTYYGNQQYAQVDSMAHDSAGNVYFCGSEFDSGWKGHVVKINSSGTFQWNKRISGTTSGVNSIFIDSSDGVYVGYWDGAVFSSSSYVYTDLHTTKLNSSTGAIIWDRKVVGYPDGPGIPTITGDSSGGIYTTLGKQVIKHNSSGTFQWSRRLYSGLFYGVSAIDSTLYATGFGTSNGFITELATDGSTTSGTAYHTISADVTDSAGSQTVSNGTSEVEAHTGPEQAGTATVSTASTALTVYSQAAVTGAGGLVWLKSRTSTASHSLWDTIRPAYNYLVSSSTAGNASVSATNALTAFNANGFTLNGTSNSWNGSQNYASWTFREQPKFFDVVTYTGDGTSPRAISHNLASAPGCVIIKQTNTTNDWCVWHTATGNDKSAALNSTDAFATFTQRIKSVTSTTFSVGNSSTVNDSGATYVAYLFAHNAGGFGLTGSDNAISCGSFTTDSGGNATVTLGYEPAWLMFKCSSDAGQNWEMIDTMRGWSMSTDVAVQANSPVAEASGGYGNPTATGFVMGGQGNTQTYIYIAIRRGPMKVPTDATKVFAPVTYVGDNSTTAGQLVTSGFPVDLGFNRYKVNGAGDWDAVDRLRGLTSIGVSPNSIYLNPPSTAHENIGGYIFKATNTGVYNYGFSSANTQLNYLFGRAPSFFDIVCYTGTGSTTTITHNLGVTPELLIVKRRTSTATDWAVYNATITASYELQLNVADAKQTGSQMYWANTAPTSTVFTVRGAGGGINDVNRSGDSYVAYLFATCAGVSKVGSYTGTGATQTISCGFTGGARFVLIKRTDSTGDWYMWDTARGMVSGTDPSILLNSNDVQVSANSVYTTTGGFQIVSTAAGINASGGTYIFLAIA